MTGQITPFEVHVPQSDLDDLRERLARTRWIDEFPGSGWSYGTSRAYLQELCGYWQVDMFLSFSHCGGDLERSFTNDELLANLTTPRPEAKGRGFQPSPAGVPVSRPAAPEMSPGVLRQLRRQSRQDRPPGCSSPR